MEIPAVVIYARTAIGCSMATVGADAPAAICVRAAGAHILGQPAA